MLQKFFKTISTLIILGVFVYVFYANFGNVWLDLYNKYFPCQKSIVYNLGSFDPQFGLSKKDFLQNLKDAEAIWEKPFGREFFTYKADDNADDVLIINLIYDYRQEATVKIHSLGLAVDANRASYDSLKTKYTTMQKDYLQAKNEYQLKINTFKRGQIQLSEIRNMETDLNKRVDDINALVTVINDLARTLNINVVALNTVGESRGEEFTEGEYKSDQNGEEINIYEFSTKEKLTRVLAHELGHALGLDHVDDPEAIMYYLNDNKNGKLTQADLDILKINCKIK